MSGLPPSSAWRSRVLPHPPGAEQARLIGVGDGFLLVIAPDPLRNERPWMLLSAEGGDAADYLRAPTAKNRVVASAGGRWLTGSASADDHSALACVWSVDEQDEDEEPTWRLLHEDGWSTSHAAAASLAGVCGRAWPKGARGAFAALWVDSAQAPQLFSGPDEHAQLFASDGAEHVGDAYVVGGGRAQAALWRGDDAATTALGPPGAWTSSARGVAGGVQAGIVWTGDSRRARAALWRGDAASFVDVTPETAEQGVVRVAANGVQVGVVTSSEDRWTSVGMTPRAGARATAWAGSAKSAVDLHSVLGAAVRSDVTGVRVTDDRLVVFGTQWVPTPDGERPEAVVWETSR